MQKIRTESRAPLEICDGEFHTGWLYPARGATGSNRVINSMQRDRSGTALSLLTKTHRHLPGCRFESRGFGVLAGSAVVIVVVTSVDALSVYEPRCQRQGLDAERRSRLFSHGGISASSESFRLARTRRNAAGSHFTFQRTKSRSVAHLDTVTGTAIAPSPWLCP